MPNPLRSPRSGTRLLSQEPRSDPTTAIPAMLSATDDE